MSVVLSAIPTSYNGDIYVTSANGSYVYLLAKLRKTEKRNFIKFARYIEHDKGTIVWVNVVAGSPYAFRFPFY